MSKVGELIKAKREELQLTQEDISLKTAIRIPFIEVLENGDFNSLPSYVHAYGFLEKYCKAVGLDFENDVKPLFDQECSKEFFGKTPQEIDIVKTESNKQIKIEKKVVFTVAGILVGMCVFTFLIIGLFSSAADIEAEVEQDVLSIPPKIVEGKAAIDSQDSTLLNQKKDVVEIKDNNNYKLDGNTEIKDDHTKAIAAAISSIAATIENEALAEDTEEEVSQDLPDVKKKYAVFKFSQDCWVSYLTDNVTYGEFTGYAGSQVSVSFIDGFKVKLGNAYGVTIEYNGDKYGSLGRENEVVVNSFKLDDKGKLLMKSARW